MKSLLNYHSHYCYMQIFVQEHTIFASCFVYHLYQIINNCSSAENESSSQECTEVLACDRYYVND